MLLKRKRSSLVLSKDGKVLICGDLNGGLDVIDVEASEVIWSKVGERAQSSDYMQSGAIASMTHRAVIGFSRGSIELWDLESRQKINTFAHHADRVLDVAISPDETLACSVSWDYTLKVWELNTGKVMATFSIDDFWCSCLFGRDSRHILAGDTRGCVHFFYLEGLPISNRPNY